MNEKTSRDNRWDMVKGIGITLMVLGHSGIPDYLYRFIYLFHMGLFFFVAGYFLKLPKSCKDLKWYKDYSLFTKKKLKALYLPYVKYGLFFLIFHNVFYQLHLIKDHYTLTAYFRKLVGILLFKDVEPFAIPLWFLRSLFVALLLSYLIIHIKSMSKQAFVVLFIYSFGYYMVWKGYVLPCQIQRECIVTSAVWLGYYFRNRSYIFEIRTMYFLFLLFILTISSTFVRIDVVNNLFAFPFAFPIYSILGVFFCYNIVLKLWELMPKCGNALSFYGKHSIEVLALHFFGLKISSCIIVYVLNVAQEDELANSIIILSLKETPYCVLNFISATFIPTIYIICKIYFMKRKSILFKEH